MFNPAQQSVMDHGLLESGFSVILQMPTGSGKTWLAKQALLDSLKRGLRGIYLAPLKALAEELSEQWKTEFKDSHIGVFTGDYGKNGQKYPVSFSNSQILIMTPERLDACTRRWRSHWSWIPEIDWIVVDEIHLLGDSNRGARLEGTLSRIRRLNPFCRILGLSATLGNRGELADWLEGVEFCHEWRPVPLEWKELHYRKANDKVNVLLKALKPIQELQGQSIVFVQSRRRSEHLASVLREEGFLAKHHHAGLTLSKRSETEKSFRNKETKILIATGTLEMGINLPARQVVLYDLHGFNGTGFTPLTVNTVWQRAGRAGRPGFDEQGEVVLLTPSWDRSTNHYAQGRFESIRSKISEPHTLAEQILLEVYAGLARTANELEKVFSTSLAVFQKQPLSVTETIQDMIDSGMLKEEKKETKTLLKATSLGRIACRHHLQPQTILRLKTFLEAFQVFTEFDLLIAAVSSPDCQPILCVDYEEIEKLSEEISQQSSVLFQNPSRVPEILKVDGKRLLSSLKGALVLWRWTVFGDIELVAEEDGCYPFEIYLLIESVDRLLLAACSIQKILDQQENMTESETDVEAIESSPSMIRIELLRQMLLTGLEKEQASLTLINGLGTTMITRLLEFGINNLNDLKEANPVHLGTVKGLSEKRAKRWIEDAREVQIKIPPDIAAYRLNGVASEIYLSVDPYRLRRALNLDVKFLKSGEWIVRGGSEPRQVTKIYNGYKCSCPDFSKGNHCKHIMAVQLEMNDPELSVAAKQIQQSIQHPYLELFGLWFQ